MHTKIPAPKSTAALVCGILGLLLFLVPLVGLGLSVAAIVLGAKAMSASNRSEGTMSGGLGVAGFVCGIVGIPLGLLGLIAPLIISGGGATAPFIYSLF